MTATRPLVVSMGEPSGIGPDIILKSWAARVTDGLPFFYVYGDPALLRERAKMIGLDLEVIEIADGSETAETFQKGLPVISGLPLHEIKAGELSSASGAFVIDAIKCAVMDIHKGIASAIVTGPIHKAALYECGFKFPGHTEFLAALSEEYYGQACRPVMMLSSDMLRVVPVTIHVPLADVPSLLTKELIEETVIILDRDLKSHFGFERPRILITGLNPHAGEDGKLGREETDIIIPAIDTLKARGIEVSGPYSADICFHGAARKGYDAAVAMYHDQALIPIKTLAFDEGVNVTLGLPFIRTSPDHGTALDIAGSGTASMSSFVSALKMATAMADRDYSQADEAQ